VTDQFPVIGLKLKKSKIIFYGLNKETKEKQLLCFVYDAEKDGFFLSTGKVRFNLVGYFYRKIVVNSMK